MRVTERRRRGEEEGERENDTTAGTINARIYIFHGTSNRRERFGEVSLGKNPFESISVYSNVYFYSLIFATTITIIITTISWIKFPPRTRGRGGLD